MSETLLRAIGLEKRFGAVIALRGVDLELPRGRTLSLLGPNGAGKSTLLRIIAGLAHGTAGRIEWSGGRPPRVGVGYLGHATLLYPELTARENLIFAARLQRVGNPAERADRLLEEEGLSAAADRRAGTFSRGMSQRLSIARARIHDPDLLLLDEPYTGLDHRSATRLSERLAGLRARGHAFVLVTHDVTHAAALSDEVLVLVRGQVAQRISGSELSIESLTRAYDEAIDSGAWAGDAAPTGGTP